MPKKKRKPAKGDDDFTKISGGYIKWLSKSLSARFFVIGVFISPLVYLLSASLLTFSSAENILLSTYCFSCLCLMFSIKKLIEDRNELWSYRFKDLKRWEGWTFMKYRYITDNYSDDSVKRMARTIGHSKASIRQILVKNGLYESYLSSRVAKGIVGFYEASRIAKKTGIKIPWSEDGDDEIDLFEYQRPIDVEWPLIDELIRTKNDSRLEFLETAFNDKQSLKANESTKHQFVMHVAAFLNSAGGQVVIGINGDGIITGLKTDGYTAGYLYKKKLKILIEKTLGEDILKYLDIRCIDALYTNKNHRNRNKQVCLVTCYKTPDTVHCVHRQYNIKNGLDVLEPIKYLRVGSATRMSTAKKPPYLRVI